MARKTLNKAVTSQKAIAKVDDPYGMDDAMESSVQTMISDVTRFLVSL